MKKCICAAIAAVLFIFSCVPAFAAGINSAEQSVLANMRTPANMNGSEVYVPASYVNQAESHFNTIDMTDAQANEINSLIASGRALLESSGKTSIKELSASEKQQLLSYASAAATVLDLAVPVGVDPSHIKIISKNGEVIVDEGENIIKTTGGNSFSVLFAEGAVLGGITLLCAAGAVILRKRKVKNEEN